MNIFSTPQIHAKAKAGSAGGDNILDILGNTNQLTPEQVEALQKQGKLDTEFAGLLGEQSSKNENGTGNEKQNPELLSNALTAKEQKVSQKPIEQALLETASDKPLQSEKTTVEAQQIKNKIAGLNPKNQKSELTQLLYGNNNNKKATNHNLETAKVQKATLSQNLGQAPAMNTPEQVIGQEQIQAAAVLPFAGKKSQGLKNGKNIATNKVTPNIKGETDKSVANNKSNLVSFNDFIGMQSQSSKKRVSQGAYKPVSESMFAQKIENTLPKLDGKAGPVAEVKLQDVMFNQGMNTSAEQGEVVAPVVESNNSSMPVSTTKVLDLSASNLSSNTNDVISQIENYIIRTNASNQKEVQMSFKHDDLGRVDLLVQKANDNQLNISIATNTQDGAKFFQGHQADLLNTLHQSGISVRDFKLDTSQSSNQNLAQDSGRNGFENQGKSGQHQSQSGQRQEEQQRRDELWQYYQDKEVA